MAEKYVKLADIIDTLENEWGYKGMQEDLNKLPTADVVEVVRCKDCKHWQHEEDVDFACGRNYGYRTSMDFCSYGKRKEHQ